MDNEGVIHYSEKKPEHIEPDEITLKTDKKEKTAQILTELTEKDIAGQWLVDESLFLPNSTGKIVIWEFNAGDWTVIKEGEKHPGGNYQLIGNTIDFGELVFEVIDLKSNTITASSAGQIFTMNRN